LILKSNLTLKKLLKDINIAGEKFTMRRYHDIGGIKAGPVDRTERIHLLWETRVDAIVRILSSKKCQIIKIDEVRRGIEDLEASAYDKYEYYERWIASVTNILIEKGVINIDELALRIRHIKNKQDFIS
jgi:hypothetical protein